MSAQQRSIYRLLAEHEYVVHYSSGSVCTCGFVPNVTPAAVLTQRQYHRGHLAKVLAARLSAEEQP